MEQNYVTATLCIVLKQPRSSETEKNSETAGHKKEQTACEHSQEETQN